MVSSLCSAQFQQAYEIEDNNEQEVTTKKMLELIGDDNTLLKTYSREDKNQPMPLPVYIRNSIAHRGTNMENTFEPEELRTVLEFLRKCLTNRRHKGHCKFKKTSGDEILWNVKKAIQASWIFLERQLLPISNSQLATTDFLVNHLHIERKCDLLMLSLILPVCSPQNMRVLTRIKVNIINLVFTACENYVYSKSMCETGFVVDPPSRPTFFLGRSLSSIFPCVKSATTNRERLISATISSSILFACFFCRLRTGSYPASVIAGRMSFLPNFIHRIVIPIATKLGRILIRFFNFF